MVRTGAERAWAERVAGRNVRGPNAWPGRAVGPEPRRADIMGDMSTETETRLIDVTERAAQKAIQLAGREGRSEACLRVRVLAGGCSGFSYKLSFEDAPVQDDHVVEAFGLRVLVDPRSAPIVRGSTLEFSDALLGGGFRMNNPQAVHECACGESFSI
jgi:iron-sulfur cluster assembly accessory protein